ncbi:MAG: glycosyltransferase family 2 protein [Pseudomonadota bacterium]
MGFKTSVIIVSYNNFDTTTGPCLESLFADTTDPGREIILIDNASQDDTPKKLEEQVSGRSDVRVVLNDANRGFAGGNNDGANIARGEILILLNSDTRVPADAMGKLSRMLSDHPDWGMLGPVTNEAGNEQKIFVESLEPERIIREGDGWCSHSRGDCFSSERLDFFCVAVRKTDYEKLGGLDEQFGPGYYEDTDFSIRAKRAGLNMIFTEDVFIYHKAGKSFSKMGRKYVKNLMRENRKKLEKKHPGRVELHHIRDRNMHVMNQYVLLKKDVGGVEDAALAYKFDNRLKLARTMNPGNPLKKLIYRGRLNRLCSKFSAGANRSS